MTTDVETSEPIGFYNLGVCYLDTARSALAAINLRRFDYPIQLLIAHGLELIFKADLRRTRSLETVRKTYGHNLTKMYLALSANFNHHFKVDEKFESLVGYLAVGHSGPDWHNRYLRTGCEFRSFDSAGMVKAVENFTTDDRRWLIAHFARSSE